MVDRGSSWCHINRICECFYLTRFEDEKSAVCVVIDGNVLWLLGFGGLEDGRDLGLKANSWGPFSVNDSHQTLNSPLSVARSHFGRLSDAASCFTAFEALQIGHDRVTGIKLTFDSQSTTGFGLDDGYPINCMRRNARN